MTGHKQISTAITNLLGIHHPILLAPMGGVSGAVSAAGDRRPWSGRCRLCQSESRFGSDDWTRCEFDRSGNQAIGIGFITWALDQRPGALDVALKRGSRAALLSFGDISPYAARIRDAGAILICQVQTLKEAIELRLRTKAPRSLLPGAPKPVVAKENVRHFH